MQRDTNKPLFAGGFLILVGFLGGSAWGISEGQPSLGTMIGVGVAAVIAALLWLFRRERRG
jgi:membrane protein DedA with SNARE-associated domain